MLCPRPFRKPYAVGTRADGPPCVDSGYRPTSAMPWCCFAPRKQTGSPGKSWMWMEALRSWTHTFHWKSSKYRLQEALTPPKHKLMDGVEGEAVTDECEAALVLGQAIAHEVGDSARRGWIEIRQHRDHVAALRKDLQLAIHSGRPAAMTEVAKRSVCAVIHKPKRVFHTPWCVYLPAG